MRTAAVIGNAHAVAERIQRGRAHRAGKTWAPEPLEIFIRDRSKHTH
jgi:hypothetical protein